MTRNRRFIFARLDEERSALIATYSVSATYSQQFTTATGEVVYVDGFTRTEEIEERLPFSSQAEYDSLLRRFSRELGWNGR